MTERGIRERRGEDCDGDPRGERTNREAAVRHAVYEHEVMQVFTDFGRNFLVAVRQAIGRVLRAGLLGFVLGALLAEVAGLLLNGGWPPQTFTHAVAGALAVTLGYALAVTVAAVEGVRGMVGAVTQLDNLAKATTNAIANAATGPLGTSQLGDFVKAAADRGLGVADTVVDALDGPNRHGFRGVRGTAN